MRMCKQTCGRAPLRRRRRSAVATREMTLKEGEKGLVKRRMSFRDVAATLSPVKDDGMRLRGYFSNLKGLYLELLNSHKVIKRQLLEKEKENCGLSSRNASLRRKIDQLAALPGDLKKKVQTLEQQVADKDAELEQLAEQAKQAKLSMEKQSEEVIHLKTRIIHIQDECDLKIAFQKSEHVVERSKLEADIVQLEGQLQSLRRLEERSKLSLEEESRKDALIQALRGKVFALLARVESQETRLLRLNQELHEGVQKDQSQLQAYEAEKEAWTRRQKSLESELSTYDATNQQLHCDLKSARTRVEELSTELEDLKRETHQDRTTFEDRLLQLESDRKACRMELLDQIHALTRSREQLESTHRQELDRLRADLQADRWSTVRGLRQHCHRLEQALEAALEHVDALQQDAARTSQDRDARVQALQASLASALTSDPPSEPRDPPPCDPGVPRGPVGC